MRLGLYYDYLKNVEINKMIDEEIIIKAIQQAVANGLTSEKADIDLADSQDYEIIFNHDFAKAFWGEEYVDDRLGESKNEWIERTGSEKNWGFHKLRYQYHLQQMILEKEPLKYLEKFL